MARLIVYLVFGVFCWVPALSLAALQGDYTIVIKDHKFDPAVLDVPSGKKVKLIIDNQDTSTEEFESFQLGREKVVVGGKKILIFIGPLKPGVYKYFGDFHPQTAQGVINAQ